MRFITFLMLKILMIGFISGLLSGLLGGCAPVQVTSSTGTDENEPVFIVEDVPVSRQEFLYNLHKNNYDRDSLIGRAEIDEYLDLYINFKLKVYEARQLGLDTTEAFLSEFNMYRDQLTESYLKDDSVVDMLVRSAYERMKTEVSASHILIRVNNFSDPGDTLRGWEKAQEIHRQILDGGDFTQMALTYSEDPSVRENKGYLGYFTALQMIYPFEEAAFNTPVGEISPPIRTRFGYHILKVHDRRPSRGEVQVAHIMLVHPRTGNPEDSLQNVGQINAIYDSVTMDGRWDYYCRKYSQDRNTRNNGGVLAPFGTGRIVASFSEAAFALEEPGDISEPVATSSGWHIIKLIRKIPMKSFDELEEEIRNKVKQDSRSELSREWLISRLKEENDFRMVEATREKVLTYADSSLLEGAWTYDSLDTFTGMTLFEIGTEPYAVEDFFGYAVTHQKKNPNARPDYYMNKLLEDFIEESNLEYEKVHLPEKNLEYRMLVNEYREGILLFELMDRKVWSRAVEDSAGLKTFYEDHQQDYMWDTRLSATLFKTDNLEDIEWVREQLQEPYYDFDTVSVSFAGLDELRKKLLQDPMDSIYGLAAEEAALLLEVRPVAGSTTEAILEEILHLDLDTSLFVFTGPGSGPGRIHLVSSAKKDLHRLNNHKSVVNLHIESGIFSRGDHEIIDMIDWEPGIHELSIETDEYLVHVDEIVPPGPKKLEETRGAVISDYQNYLEKAWISELKEKYTIDINRKVLESIYREFEKD